MKDLIEDIIDSRAVVSLAYNKSHFIKFSEFIARKFSIESSVLVGILIDLENIWLEKHEEFLKKSKGFIPLKSQYVVDRVGLSYHRQKIALKELSDAKLLEQKKWAGNVILFRIDHLRLSKILVDGSIDKMKNKKNEGKIYENFNEKFEEMSKFKEAIANPEAYETLIKASKS
jgi:hypothetical protein